MKVKELIIKLLELPMDASIGIANYDENDELWGESVIDLIDNTKNNKNKSEKVLLGENNLEYYFR